MPNLRSLLIAALLGLCLPAVADETAPANTPTSAPATVASSHAIDSTQLEHDMQSLPWPKFKSVVEAVPKMKASVDAYGPLGWQYVEKNYRSHGWKKNIDRLDDEQRQQLAQLVQRAKHGK